MFASCFASGAAEVAAFEGIPFYDTINREQNPSDPVWWSCLFIALENENTYCDDEYREVGQIVLIVSAQPGIGDADAVQAIEIIIPALLGKTIRQTGLCWIAGSRRLRIQQEAPTVNIVSVW